MIEIIVAVVVFCVSAFIALSWMFKPESKTITVREKLHRHPSIPGLDSSDKILGNFRDIDKEGSLHEFLLKLHERFGPIAGFWFGKEYVVSLASPELFKEHLKLYNRPAIFFETFRPLLGDNSIQYSNGSEWKNRRRMYDKYFNHQMLTSYISIFTEIGKDWVKRREESVVKVVNSLHDDMMSLALKSILSTAFGFTIKDQEQADLFSRLYDDIWMEVESRQFGTPTAKNSEEELKLSNSMKILRSQVQGIISNRKKSRETDSYIFLDYLVDNSLTEQELMDEVITYIIGGFHTTGNLLTWTFYFMARNPDVQEKVYNELVEVLGDDEYITTEKINQLIYTNQVIKESLRCSVLAPYAARFNNEDVTVGGHVIVGGTPVIHALGVVLQDHKIWPEPQKFDPNRFSLKNSQERSALSFCAFGFAGQRICPGQKFSSFEMFSFMSVICRAFRMKLAENISVNRVHGLVTKPDREIKMIFESRQ